MKKKTPKILLNKLNKFIKEHGKVKTALALGLKETNAINNWIARQEIPEPKQIKVRELENLLEIKVVFK